MSICRLIVDGNQGIYCPQVFCMRMKEVLMLADRIDIADIEAVIAGPENESYYDSWNDIVKEYRSKDGLTIYEDGDIYLVSDDWSREDEGSEEDEERSFGHSLYVSPNEDYFFNSGN